MLDIRQLPGFDRLKFPHQAPAQRQHPRIVMTAADQLNTERQSMRAETNPHDDECKEGSDKRENLRVG